MIRTMSLVSATIMGIALLGGTARAAFSPATAACIKQATSARKACVLMASAATCTAEFYTAYADCFAPGDGVACATNCESGRTACEDPVQATERTCVHTCGATRATALKACAGDATCGATVTAAFSACKKACVQQETPGILACRGEFALCIAQCPNL